MRTNGRTATQTASIDTQHKMISNHFDSYRNMLSQTGGQTVEQTLKRHHVTINQ